MIGIDTEPNYTIYKIYIESCVNTPRENTIYFEMMELTQY